MPKYSKLGSYLQEKKDGEGFFISFCQNVTILMFMLHSYRNMF